MTVNAMRLCHVSPHLPPDQAANALLPADLGRWAAADGATVTFLTHEPAQGSARPVAPAGRVVHLPRRQPTSGLRRLLRLDAVRRVRLITSALDDVAGGCDLLHLHSNGLLIEVAAAWARRRRIPFVLTLYGTEIWHYRRRWPFDPFTRAYANARAVTFYSRGLMDRARELGLRRGDLHVVYPAVAPAFRPRDEAARAALKAELGVPEAFVVLNVKRLHELAGQTFLIDAFAKACRGRDDARLVICGTGPLGASLEAQAQAAGIGHLVTFAGLVPNEQVAKYAAAADVFALPSLLEALPTVAVEALASGTPVLSADHPGGVELQALFGDAVQVVPRSDVVRLSVALDEFRQRPRRAGPDTMATVARHFGPASVWRQYQAVYAGATAGPGWGGRPR